MSNVWYCRESVGSDTNGGSSATVRASGTDGVTNGTNTLTSASASFTSALVGHYVYISGSVTGWRQVTAASGTSLTFSGATIAAATGLTYAVGGARKTLANMFQTSPVSPFAAGDTIWLGAGTYRGMTTINVTGSTTIQTLIAGDVGGINTGDAGEVILSPYTAGDISGSTGLNFTVTCSATPHNYVLQDLTVYGPATSSNGGSFVTMDFSQVATAHIGLIVQRCAIYGPTSNQNVATGLPAGCAALALMPDGTTSSLPSEVRSCSIFHWDSSTGSSQPGYSGNTLGLSAAACIIFRNATATQYMNMRNCLILHVIFGAPGWMSTFIPCGNNSSLGLYGCTIFANTAPIFNWGNGPSFGSDSKIENCVFFGTNGANGFGYHASWTVKDTVIYGISKGTVTGSGGTYTNITYGQTPPAFDIGQSALRRAPAKPFFTPSMNAGASASPVFGMGSHAEPLLSDDFLGQSRSQASSGMGATLGYMEPWAPALINTNPTFVHAGNGSLKLLGFSSHSFEMPVDAVPTTVSFYCCCDSNYGGTNYPSIQVRDGSQCGVADQEVSATSATANTWQQVTVSFTPTSPGIVTIRLVAKSSAIAGATYWDD